MPGQTQPDGRQPGPASQDLTTGCKQPSSDNNTKALAVLVLNFTDIFSLVTILDVWITEGDTDDTKDRLRELLDSVDDLNPGNDSKSPGLSRLSRQGDGDDSNNPQFVGDNENKKLDVDSELLQVFNGKLSWARSAKKQLLRSLRILVGLSKGGLAGPRFYFILWNEILFNFSTIYTWYVVLSKTSIIYQIYMKNTHVKN